MSAPGRVIRQVAALASERVRAEIREHMVSGGLMLYPTATVYGVGGLAAPEALARLETLKRRPPEKPFVVLVGHPDQLADLEWTDSARTLADRFWPGPLTLILPDPREAWPAGLRGPGGGVAVRQSPHLGAQALLTSAGGPITSSSANEPGGDPAASGAEALALAGRTGWEGTWVLDGGRLPSSASSTIVDCTGAEPQVLREGAIPTEAVTSALAGGGVEMDRPWVRPVHVCFVCTGNTCRSPLAEVIARQRLRELGLGRVRVSSAGVHAWSGQPASPESVDVARRRGLDLHDHRSRGLLADELDDLDLLLTMGPEHLEPLLHSDAGARSSTLGAFADGREDPFDGVSVPDPIGLGMDVYEATFRRLEEMIGLAFARLRPILAGP